MSTIALFLALGGGAYVVTVPKNSVRPSQIKPGASRIRVARTDSANITAVGQLGYQLGALQLSGEPVSNSHTLVTPVS